MEEDDGFYDTNERAVRRYQLYLRIANIAYAVISLIVIGVAAAANVGGFGSLAVTGGVVACGVFLLLVSGFGFFGAHKKKTGLLFIYMIILSILFVIQFSVSVALISISPDQQEEILQFAWTHSDNNTITHIQDQFECCGFADRTTEVLPCDPTFANGCFTLLRDSLQNVMRAAGGVGLFFAFTEIAGVFCSFKFRQISKRNRSFDNI